MLLLLGFPGFFPGLSPHPHHYNVLQYCQYGLCSLYGLYIKANLWLRAEAGADGEDLYY